MNWYKNAQYYSQRQDLKPEDFSSILKKSQTIIEEFNLESVLGQFAEQKGYEEPIDYVLCSLYPEIEKHCKAYYQSKEKKLKDLYSQKEIQKMDDIVSKAIVVFNGQYQKMLKEQNELV